MTKIISLSALRKEPAVIIDIDGERHPMQAATVETFIENMKALEELSLNASPVKELEVAVAIIGRAFPTLTEKTIRGWTLETIQQLSELARGVSGEIATTDEAAAAEAEASGNDLKAN